MIQTNTDELPGQIMSNSTIIEEWRRKSASVESRADDSLITLFDKAFETMSIVLSQPYPDAKAALQDVNIARETLEEQDLEKTDVIRNLLYGFVQTLHITIDQLLEDRNDLKMAIERWTRPQELLSSSVNLPLIAEHEIDAQVRHAPSEEPIVDVMDVDSSERLEEVDDVKYDWETDARTDKGGRVFKKTAINRGKSTLACPSCEYEASSTNGFVIHLKNIHRKTMGQASRASLQVLMREKNPNRIAGRVRSCCNARITLVSASLAAIPKKVEIRKKEHSTIRRRPSVLPQSDSGTPGRSRRLRKSPFRINISGGNSQSYKEISV